MRAYRTREILEAKKEAADRGAKNSVIYIPTLEGIEGKAPTLPRRGGPKGKERT